MDRPSRPLVFAIVGALGEDKVRVWLNKPSEALALCLVDGNLLIRKCWDRSNSHVIKFDFSVVGAYSKFI
jgi:hypothetical protein